MFSSLSSVSVCLAPHLSLLQFRLSRTSHPSHSLSLHHCALFPGLFFLTGECLRTLWTPLWRYLSLSSPSTCGVNVLSWPVSRCVCFNMYTNPLAPSWSLPLSPSPFFLLVFLFHSSSLSGTCWKNHSKLAAVFWDLLAVLSSDFYSVQFVSMKYEQWQNYGSLKERLFQYSLKFKTTNRK